MPDGLRLMAGGWHGRVRVDVVSRPASSVPRRLLGRQH